MNLRYIPGLRGIKTMLAVFICLLISTALLRRDTAFYSMIAAIICMQPTYEQSLELGVNRTVGTLIGGFVGYLTLELYRVLPPGTDWAFLVVIPLATLLAIYLANVLGKEKSTAICCIVLLSISLNHGDNVQGAIQFAFNRVVDTLIGIVVAILINRFVFPPKSKAPQAAPPSPPPAEG